MHQTVHPDDGPGPMDRPRQGDSLAGNMAGQIIGIACGSVGSKIMRRGVEHNNNNNRPVVSGLPQGTVLGPLLFLILLSDIDTDIESDIISFADDTRIYRGVNDTNGSENLQSDLDTVYLWAD